MILCVTIPLTACQAQAKSNKIDVVSYNIPSGFSAESEGNASARAFTKKYGGDKFAFITLYASTNSFGDANTDFSRRWQQLLAGMAQNKTVPKAERSNISGITILNGYSNIVYEGTPAIGLLTTLTVNGRLITIVGVFNDKQGQTDYQAFLDGLDIDDAIVNQKPTVAAKPSAPARQTNVATNSAGVDPRFFGGWIKALSKANGNYGRRYYFNQDGTFWDPSITNGSKKRGPRVTVLPNNWKVFGDPGKWQVSGNMLKLVFNDGSVEEFSFEFSEFKLFETSKPSLNLRWTKTDGTVQLFEKLTDQYSPLDTYK
jgi:hypothetical protein